MYLDVSFLNTALLTLRFRLFPLYGPPTPTVLPKLFRCSVQEDCLACVIMLKMPYFA